jgi:type II secretory pathway component PulL
MIKDNKDKYASWDCKYTCVSSEDIFVFSKGSISIEARSEIREHMTNLKLYKDNKVILNSGSTTVIYASDEIDPKKVEQLKQNLSYVNRDTEQLVAYFFFLKSINIL